jgi:hypothetical protein
MDGFSVWKIEEEYLKGLDFWEYRNPVLVHDGGAYNIEEEADDEEWKREIAREAGMLNGIESYNDYWG